MVRNDDETRRIENTKLAYSFEEAAEATGYSVATIRTAVRNHDLIARYANSKPVIRTCELDDWLRSLPTEPRGGHRPVSQLVDADPSGWPARPTQSAVAEPAPATPQFRTPEQVAPELGVSKSGLRSYCRTSGIYTKVGNRIMLHADDIPRLVEWIQNYQKTERERARTEVDHFA